MSKTSVAIDINSRSWGNDNAFSQMVYIDTNAIIDIFEQRSHGQVTENYIKELVRRDGMIIWSQHTIDEVTDFVHTDEYKKYAKNNSIKSNHQKAAWKIAEDKVKNTDSAQIANLVTQRIETITDYLEQFGMQTDINNSSFINLTKVIYTNYGGNRKDSQHVAIANLSGVNNILTQDAGFLRYPVNVFGASRSIASQYSAGQTTNKYLDLEKLFLNKEENKEDVG